MLKVNSSGVKVPTQAYVGRSIPPRGSEQACWDETGMPLRGVSEATGPVFPPKDGQAAPKRRRV